MNREDQIRLTCVQAIEKGLVPLTGGWSREKAAALLTALKDRPKANLPASTQPTEVYDIILDILADLEDAEPRYVPKWAKALLAG